MSRLLIIDDEPNMRYSLEKGLRSDSLDVVTAADGREGLNAARCENPDVILLDVRLPDMNGFEVFQQLRRNDARLPVIVITAHATTETAIEAMKLGAFEYVVKPIGIERLRTLVGQAVELSRLSRVPARIDRDDAAPDSADGDCIVGQSAEMREVYKQIGRVASQEVPVLILGESGTGKELVARAIYQHSRRADKLFLTVNAAAIPETLLESELFGHERGTFTGADRRRIGKFEQAHGGTLFLDEIGDMTPATQAKMLRLLQDGNFQRVGGNQTIHADVRVVAATNQDLGTMIEDGTFRRDLFYRLNVYTISLPPLRRRTEDLPMLVDYFLRRHAALGENRVCGVSESALDMLRSYSWPGNVRELESAVKHALLNARADVLTPDSFPTPCQAADAPAVDDSRLDLPARIQDLIESGEGNIHRRLHDDLDRLLLKTVLRHTHGNQREAARILGISRTTLRTYIDALGPNVIDRSNF